jgi:ribosomal protein S18 acetylase RimI-like enzyme
VTSAAITVRRARKEDLPALGRMGALLMRLHYEFDNKRFMDPGDDPASGYAWFLGSQLRDEDVIVLVAERERAVVGYIYAALEPLSWKELRDACGYIHDIVVAEEGRRLGVASALVEAAIQWLREKGAPRVILGTAQPNTRAQALFEKLGFRRTMIEMTREI